MTTLINHAESMIRRLPPGLDREVARDYLLQQSEKLEVMVIYDYPADALFVYRFQPDPITLAFLMDCHNKYIGANELGEEHRRFIRTFPERFEDHKVLDNTDAQSRWLGLTTPTSFVFVMGNFDDARQQPGTDAPGELADSPAPGVPSLVDGDECP